MTSQTSQWPGGKVGFKVSREVANKFRRALSLRYGSYWGIMREELEALLNNRADELIQEAELAQKEKETSQAEKNDDSKLVEDLPLKVPERPVPGASPPPATEKVTQIEI